MADKDADKDKKDEKESGVEVRESLSAAWTGSSSAPRVDVAGRRRNIE